MPHATPQSYQYTHVPETKEDLDWADRKFDQVFFHDCHIHSELIRISN